MRISDTMPVRMAGLIPWTPTWRLWDLLIPGHGIGTRTFRAIPSTIMTRGTGGEEDDGQSRYYKWAKGGQLSMVSQDAEHVLPVRLDEPSGGLNDDAQWHDADARFLTTRGN